MPDAPRCRECGDPATRLYHMQVRGRLLIEGTVQEVPVCSNKEHVAAVLKLGTVLREPATVEVPA